MDSRKAIPFQEAQASSRRGSGSHGPCTRSAFTKSAFSLNAAAKDAVFGEMVRLGLGIAGIPSRDLFLNDVPNSKSFSFIDCVAAGVDRVQRNFEPM